MGERTGRPQARRPRRLRLTARRSSTPRSLIAAAGPRRRTANLPLFPPLRSRRPPPPERRRIVHGRVPERARARCSHLGTSGIFVSRGRRTTGQPPAAPFVLAILRPLLKSQRTSEKHGVYRAVEARIRRRYRGAFDALPYRRGRCRLRQARADRARRFRSRRIKEFTLLACPSRTQPVSSPQLR